MYSYLNYYTAKLNTDKSGKTVARDPIGRTLHEVDLEEQTSKINLRTRPRGVSPAVICWRKAPMSLKSNCPHGSMLLSSLKKVTWGPQHHILLHVVLGVVL